MCGDKLISFMFRKRGNGYLKRFKTNSIKHDIVQEFPEFTPVEIEVAKSMKQEVRLDNSKPRKVIYWTLIM